MDCSTASWRPPGRPRADPGRDGYDSSRRSSGNACRLAPGSGRRPRPPPTHNDSGRTPSKSREEWAGLEEAPHPPTLAVATAMVPAARSRWLAYDLSPTHPTRGGRRGFRTSPARATGARAGPPPPFREVQCPSAGWSRRRGAVRGGRDGGRRLGGEPDQRHGRSCGAAIAADDGEACGLADTSPPVSAPPGSSARWPGRAGSHPLPGWATSYDPNPDPLTAATNWAGLRDSNACGAYVPVRPTVRA